MSDDANVSTASPVAEPASEKQANEPAPGADAKADDEPAKENGGKQAKEEGNSGEGAEGEDKDKKEGEDKDKGRDRDRDRDRKRRERSRDRDREGRDKKRQDRDRDRDRDKDRDRGRRSDRDRRGDRDRDRDRDRGKRDRDRDRDRKDKDKDRRRSRSPEPVVDPAEEERKRAEAAQKAAEKAAEAEMRAERERNRDLYTVFVSSIHPKVDERDLFEFFSMVGRVEDIRLIRDQRTQKSKGLCYVEFWEKESVHKAVTLTGQLLGGYPITIAICQSQGKGGSAEATATPMKLYVGSLHAEVTEDDLKPVFSAFGPLDFVDLHKEADGTSKGFGFVQFKNETDAKAALGQLDGLPIAGKIIKVGMVADQGGGAGAAATQHDDGVGSLEDDGHLTAQGRAALMEKLGRNAGLSAPSMPVPAPAHPAAAMSNIPMIQPTTCVVIKNMFDPKTETDADFDLDIKEDVEEEAAKFGPLKHIFVDKTSMGNVFLRFHSVQAAAQLRQTFHGRWFASRQISAEFVIEPTYFARFPDAAK